MELLIDYSFQAAGLATTLAMLYALYTQIRLQRRSREIDQRVLEINREQLDDSSRKAAPLGNLLDAGQCAPASTDVSQGLLDALTRSSERERLLQEEATISWRRLASISTTLSILALFAPIAAGYVYLSTPPLSAATLAGIEEVAESGAEVTLDTSSFSRDWHILAAGFSFGLLFLAVSRGLMKQEDKHRATYFRLAGRVRHLDALGMRLRTERALDGTALNDAMRKAIDGTLTELLKMNHQAPDASESQEKDADPLDVLREAILKR